MTVMAASRRGDGLGGGAVLDDLGLLDALEGPAVAVLLDRAGGEIPAAASFSTVFSSSDDADDWPMQTRFGGPAPIALVTVALVGAAAPAIAV